MWLLSLVDGAVVEEVGVRVVAVDFEHFGDEAASGPALDLNDDMQRVADVAFNRAVGQFDAALQHATRKPRKTLFGRVRVNGGKCPRVTRIQKLQKIEGFTATNLTEQDTVRAVTKSGFEQVADRDARKAVLRVAGLEPDEVRAGRFEFPPCLQLGESALPRV